MVGRCWVKTQTVARFAGLVAVNTDVRERKIKEDEESAWQ